MVDVKSLKCVCAICKCYAMVGKKLKEWLYRMAVLTYAGLCFYLALCGMPAELAGFAVAGALSLVFLKLESFAEFSGGGFSAKLKERVDRLQNDIEPLKSRETEPEPTQSSDKDDLKQDDETSLNEGSQQVLHSLTTSKYSWRTLTGIVADTKLPKDQISDTLFELEQCGLAVSSKSTNGRTIWGATMRGYITDAISSPNSGG